jgi:hypothetical protein
MSAQTGAGIQELMAAETRASQIVAEARMGKQFLMEWNGLSLTAASNLSLRSGWIHEDCPWARHHKGVSSHYLCFESQETNPCIFHSL